MANFRVGQRVRVINECKSGGPPIKGREATVTGVGGFFGGGVIHEYEVRVDGERMIYVCHAHDLEPLTDPGEKEFRAEDMLTLEGLTDFTIATMPADMAKAWASDRY